MDDDDFGGGVIWFFIGLFRALGWWSAPYLLVGVVILITVQHIDRHHRANHPGGMTTETHWFMDSLVAIFVVSGWPLVAFVLIWAEWKEHQTRRRHFPTRSHRNSN